jgi:sugar lactone lactonase YvrE
MVPASPAQAHPGPGIVVDAQDQVYFVDYTRDRLLQIDAAGKLWVFADGGKTDAFHVPHHLFIDTNGNLYTASDRQGKIVRVGPDGTTTQIYPPADWYGIDFLGFGGDPFVVDAAGNIYGVNRRQFKFAQILKITPEGRIAALAGGSLGMADGRGEVARFGDPHSMAFACGANGDLFVSDRTAIRSVRTDGTVWTLAGGPEAGDRDGRGAEARFTSLAGICLDSSGTLWAADPGAAKIRRISPDRSVTTFNFASDAGSDAHPAGADGGAAKLAAVRLRPVGVAVGLSGNVFVLDYPKGDDPRVSRIDRNSNVTVLAVVGIAQLATKY